MRYLTHIALVTIVATLALDAPTVAQTATS